VSQGETTGARVAGYGPSGGEDQPARRRSCYGISLRAGRDTPDRVDRTRGRWRAETGAKARV